MSKRILMEGFEPGFDVYKIFKEIFKDKEATLDEVYDAWKDIVSINLKGWIRDILYANLARQFRPYGVKPELYLQQFNAILDDPKNDNEELFYAFMEGLQKRGKINTDEDFTFIQFK